MGQQGSHIGHDVEIAKVQTGAKSTHNQDFVLEKSIFNNVFGKDIRRIYIYKKAERLAKALHLIAPAFSSSPPLRSRVSEIALALIDLAIRPSSVTRTSLSHELLALSSVLNIARVGGMLSTMNADLISKEAHSLLQEVASYEEPRVSLEEVPTLSDITRQASRGETLPRLSVEQVGAHNRRAINDKGHIKDRSQVSDSKIKDRREAIITVLKQKPEASIKDISMLIRDVSEKTIQRELLALITTGVVSKRGERRWSTYSLI